MRAVAILVTDQRALVELRPSWFAQKLGAGVHVVELVRDGADKCGRCERVALNREWRFAATDRKLARCVGREGKILAALEYRPLDTAGQIPCARVASNAG